MAVTKSVTTRRPLWLRNQLKQLFLGVPLPKKDELFKPWIFVWFILSQFLHHLRTPQNWVKYILGIKTPNLLMCTENFDIILHTLKTCSVYFRIKWNMNLLKMLKVYQVLQLQLFPGRQGKVQNHRDCEEKLSPSSVRKSTRKKKAFLKKKKGETS